MHLAARKRGYQIFYESISLSLSNARCKSRVTDNSLQNHFLLRSQPTWRSPTRRKRLNPRVPSCFLALSSKQCKFLGQSKRKRKKRRGKERKKNQSCTSNYTGERRFAIWSDMMEETDIVSMTGWVITCNPSSRWVLSWYARSKVDFPSCN